MTCLIDLENMIVSLAKFVCFFDFDFDDIHLKVFSSYRQARLLPLNDELQCDAAEAAGRGI